MHGWACWSGWQHLGLWPCAPCGLITGQGILWWFWAKVVSPVGAKQPAAPHRWGVRTPTGADLPRLWEKNPPRCAPVELGCATRLLGYGPGPCGYGPGPCGYGPGPVGYGPGPGPRCRQAKPGKSRLSGVFSAGVKLASS